MYVFFEICCALEKRSLHPCFFRGRCCPRMPVGAWKGVHLGLVFIRTVEVRPGTSQVAGRGVYSIHIHYCRRTAPVQITRFCLRRTRQAKRPRRTVRTPTVVRRSQACFLRRTAALARSALCHHVCRFQTCTARRARTRRGIYTQSVSDCRTV